MNSIGLKIKKIREYNNLTQEYMASQMDISQPAYAQLENGSSKISSQRLKQISKILNVDPKNLESCEEITLNIHNNTLNYNSSIIKELNSKQNELYERLLAEKNKVIERLENELKKLK